MPISTEAGASDVAFFGFVALACMIMSFIPGTTAEGGWSLHGVQLNSNSTPSYGSCSESGSGSKRSETNKTKNKNSTVRCYDERMTEVPCPTSKKAKIAGFILGGIVGVFLLYLVYKKVKEMIDERRETPEAQDREIEEEDGTFDLEEDGAKEGSDSPELPPPRYLDNATGESGNEPVPSSV